MDDYDLQTLLRQIHREVHTQKILLVGHSQGSFYTNALYQYLTTSGGMSPSAVAVYNIATPASSVAGGGEYLTSTNDKLINQVRELAFSWSANSPLPANISIPLTPTEAGKAFGGHEFAEVYLSGAPARIVSSVSSGLGRLGAGTDPEGDGCFILPSESLTYRAKSAAFGLIDPAVAAGAQGISLAYQGAALAVATAERLAESSLVYADTLVRSVVRAIVDTSPQDQGAAVAQALPEASVPVASVKPIVKEAPIQLPVQPKVLIPVVPPSVTFKPPPVQVPLKVQNPPLVVPGFGGGASPQETINQEVVEETESVVAPVFLNPVSGISLATTSVSVSGTTTPGYSLLLSYIPAGSGASTTLSLVSDGTGAWNTVIAVNEGTVAIDASAADSSSNRSATTTRSFIVDLTPPSAPTLSIAECVVSLSASFCLSATTTAHLSWPAVAGAAHYALSIDGAWMGTTTGLSAEATLADQATTTFRIAAYDVAGHAATSSAQEVATHVQPVVINEIAWAGTDAEAGDEWVELFNVSPYLIDLSRLALVTASGGTYAPLGGTLLPLDDFSTEPSDRDMFLLERRGEATATSSDLVYSFNLLSDAGEELHLSWGSSAGTSTLDQTPAVSVCSGWCAGSAASTTAVTAGGVASIHRVTMERAVFIGHGTTDGSLAASWVSNDTYARVQEIPPTDANGNFLYGTPRQENSAQFPVAGWYCGSSTTSIQPGSTPRPGENPTCTYLSSFIDTSVNRRGELYYGSVGSSTLVSSHALSASIKSIQTENTLPSTAHLDPYFIAIYEDRTSPSTDAMHFQDYFTIGSSTLPHSNYRVIPWTYGPPSI